MPKLPSCSREFVVVLLSIAAACCLIVGAALIYAPAGFIVAGLSLIAAAVEVQSEDSRTSD